MLEKTQEAVHYSGFVNVRQARWLVGVLSMLIAVVGKESLLGLILGQTRREIDSLVEAEDEGMAQRGTAWHLNN